MHRVAICLAVCAACSSKDPPHGALLAPRDAGGPAPTDPGDPGDPGDPDEQAPDPLADLPMRAPSRPAAARPGRPIDVILRSSPSGAMVAVDGVQVGVTPTYWAGDANGRDHEFLFVRKGYAYARYRFVPITSGVVHARLDPIADETHVSLPPELLRAPPPPAPRVDAAPVERDPATGPGPQP